VRQAVTGRVTVDPKGPTLLAHSAPERGAHGQPYAAHVNGVRAGAVARVEAMVKHAGRPMQGLVEAVEAAAVYHDLGKLDPDSQSVLRDGRSGRLRWDHVDAGVACLAARKSWMAAWLVRSHHAPGLPPNLDHFASPTDRRLRGRRNDGEPKVCHDEQIRRTDGLIDRYLASHEAAIGSCEAQGQRPQHGLAMRLALSCLVDADHSDTALFDSGRPPLPECEPRWEERLAALSEYVGRLPAGQSHSTRERNRRRRAFFEGCLRSEIADHLVACEGPVGIGKTTAVAAYLIRRARDEGLRRLIVVVPYTNILTQTAKRLRAALVLPGEHPDHVIVEHHHRADFSDPLDRELAVLWRAPIVLTTAVSFFETLAACDPASLRKLHAVPGSAMFVDEAHAALPAQLWRQGWRWLRKLTEDWGCRIVFASGSLARFWECPELVGESTKLPELMPQEQSKEAMDQERHRVRYTSAHDGQALTVRQLISLVAASPGPRLVILNTVQNAAVVAKTMRDLGHSVLHLSTALTPRDRERVLCRVERNLSDGCDAGNDWSLVATSCVEAGVDLSFRCAFRERFTAASTIQVGGRVNRHGEYDDVGGGIVYDFALSDADVTQHPAARVSADVLREYMARDLLNDRSPADVVTCAMREEIIRKGWTKGDDPLSEAERDKDYPLVQQKGRVIDTDTRFVVVDPQLKAELERGAPVNWRDLMQGSVQVWANRIDRLGLKPLSRHRDIYSWDDGYDPDFLGYMSGVLSREDVKQDPGSYII
jgi:CRISPR-associated endonuclease/helicase Cas3